MLRDVLLVHISEDALRSNSTITVSSSSREKSAQMTWEQADNLENSVLFDLSSRGTVKLASRLEGLDTRDTWVQDVDRIEVVIQ